jgi:hypothetical protein
MDDKSDHKESSKTFLSRITSTFNSSQNVNDTTSHSTTFARAFSRADSSDPNVSDPSVTPVQTQTLKRGRSLRSENITTPTTTLQRGMSGMSNASDGKPAVTLQRGVSGVSNASDGKPSATLQRGMSGVSHTSDGKPPALLQRGMSVKSISSDGRAQVGSLQRAPSGISNSSDRPPTGGLLQRALSTISGGNIAVGTNNPPVGISEPIRSRSPSVVSNSNLGALHKQQSGVSNHSSGTENHNPTKRSMDGLSVNSNDLVGSDRSKAPVTRLITRKGSQMSVASSKNRKFGSATLSAGSNENTPSKRAISRGASVKSIGGGSDNNSKGSGMVEKSSSTKGMGLSVKDKKIVIRTQSTIAGVNVEMGPVKDAKLVSRIDDILDDEISDATMSEQEDDEKPDVKSRNFEFTSNITMMHLLRVLLFFQIIGVALNNPAGTYPPLFNTVLRPVFYYCVNFYFRPFMDLVYICQYASGIFRNHFGKYLDLLMNLQNVHITYDMPSISSAHRHLSATGIDPSLLHSISAYFYKPLLEVDFMDPWNWHVVYYFSRYFLGLTMVVMAVLFTL